VADSDLLDDSFDFDQFIQRVVAEMKKLKG